MPIDTWKNLVSKASSLCLTGAPETSQLTFRTYPERDARDSEIREQEHYFGVTLNEIHLQYGREFHLTYDPLLYLAVDFKYGSQRVTVPRLIGPSVLGPSITKGGGKLPHGFVVRDIRVAGPHPYRGDPVGITVVLYKIAHTDYAKRVLAFAEKLTGVVGFPADLSMAFKIGGAVVDAVETLFDMNDSVPLMGRRFELNASPRDGFQPQQVALINSGDKPLPPLDVRGASLVQESGEPFIDRDYVLFDLWRTESRGVDADLLSETMVEKMYECGLAGDPESWRRGKSILLALYQQLLSSIDLTEADAERIFEKHKEKLLKCKERARLVSLMPVEVPESPLAQSWMNETERLNNKAREILELPD